MLTARQLADFIQRSRLLYLVIIHIHGCGLCSSGGGDVLVRGEISRGASIRSLGRDDEWDARNTVARTRWSTKVGSKNSETQGKTLEGRLFMGPV